MNFQDQTELFQSHSGGQGNHQFQDDNRPKDFSSVEKYVNMPSLRNVQPYENIFPPVQEELKNSNIMSPELKQAMVDLRDRLRNEFTTFEDSRSFKFTFPESKFPAVGPGQRNLITYEQKNIVQDEDTFKDKLSPEQINQIAQNGEFKVRSNHEYITLPYVWKINDSIFRGKHNIELAWRKKIAYAHSIMNNAKLMFTQQIPVQWKKIRKLPMRLFSLFFGKKSMKTTYSVQYNKQIGKDFWNEVMTKHYEHSREWGSQLWEYLDTKYKAQDWMMIRDTQNEENGAQNNEKATKQFNERVKKQLESRKKYNSRVQTSQAKKQRIARVGDEFQRKWAKGKKKIFEQVSTEYQKQQENIKPDQNAGNQSEQLIKTKQKINEQQILERFNNRKFQNYTSYLQKQLPKLDIPTGVIEALVTMLTLMQIITQKQRKYKAKLKQHKEKIQSKVKEDNEIKQYDLRWYHDEVNKIYKPIEQKLTEEYLNKLIDIQLINKLNIKQREVYNLWLQYRAKYPAFLEAKSKQMPEIMQPTRIFYSTYRLFPPYKVIKHTQNNYTWYEMVRQAKMQISTDKNFWKWNLYVMRVKSWSINCIVFLIYNCWKGVFGLRCLWGTKQFKYDQKIHHSTGEIIEQERKPVLAVFSTVLQGMKKSRQNFQALPDRGLFGKNFSRIFNYAQCYIFRFLFVGILITLVLYPLAIVLLSVLTFLLILTVWMWIPVVLLSTFLFNTIFFQFESSFIPYGFFVRAAPLLSLVLSLLWSLAKIGMIILYVCVMAPVGGMLVSLWAVFIRGLRSLTDRVMLLLISKLGRTPSRDTAIAKKISGPGMSKGYYMSINQQDVYILIQAQLQQIFMKQYNRVFNQKINMPVQRFNEVMKLLLAPYNGSYYYPPQSQNVIIQAVKDLRNNYSVEYQNYMNRYPIRPYNIRFTQEELDSYFENTVMIVKNFVSKMEISSWIFEDYLILEDYEELTRKIWMKVFSCGQEIFQPLEKIDQRFKLEDMNKSSNIYDQNGNNSHKFNSASMQYNVHKVMQALQGEVELKPRRAHVNAFRHNLMTRELSAVGVREVFTYMNQNSNGKVYFDQTQPKFLFYVNLPISQVIKRESYEYEWRREQASKKDKSNKN